MFEDAVARCSRLIAKIPAVQALCVSKVVDKASDVGMTYGWACTDVCVRICA